MQITSRECLEFEIEQILNIADYSEDLMIEEANTDLMGAIGNLLNRCTGAVLNPRQEYPAFIEKQLHTDQCLQLTSAIESLPGW